MIKTAKHVRPVQFLLLLIISGLTFACGFPTSGDAINAEEAFRNWSVPSALFTFVDVTEAAGINATHRGSWEEFVDGEEFTDGYLAVGQAWGDYDNDGWLDLYVTGNLDDNVLYHNNQDGSFRVAEISPSVSLPEATSGGAVWADYDNDGWRDLYVLNHGANALFHNDGGIGFTDVTEIAGVGDTGKGTTAAWGDYDNDGYLDLYVTNWSCFPGCDPLNFNLHRDRLYRNSGDGTFNDRTDALVYEKTLGSGFAASFMDFDNDGDLDIYVVNDQKRNPIGNVLWRNDGAGCKGWCWTDVSAETGTDHTLYGMGLAVGDYDNDSDLDFFFSNMGNSMALLQNQGDSTFVDQAEAAGVDLRSGTNIAGWGTCFLDYDNDGWLDLYLATTKFVQLDPLYVNKGLTFIYPNVLFQNNGNGSFTDVGSTSWREVARPSMGVACADYDNDGWLDFVVGNWNRGYRLYHNEGLTGAGNHWLTVRLVGAGPVNRDAVGARVYVATNDGRTQMQEVKSGSSLGAGNDTALHFGLGAATAEELTVVWPNGLTRSLSNVPADQIWRVGYPAEVSGLPLVPTIATMLLALLLIFGGSLAVQRYRSKDHQRMQ